MFQIEFPLPKLDTLVVSDFDSGAMENFGLIIARTSLYCLDPEEPSLDAMKEITMTQSHEVSHQWSVHQAMPSPNSWHSLTIPRGLVT
jgi:aminopeptidase 2